MDDNFSGKMSRPRAASLSEDYKVEMPQASENIQFFDNQVSATSVITDLCLELFELKEKNNWLRRQAVVLFLQQLFGDTVERKSIEAINSLFSSENTLYMLENIKNTYWINGTFQTVWPERTEDSKTKTYQSVSVKIRYLARQLSGFLGKQNAANGTMKLLHIFQNQRLNRHLLYTIFDELLYALFPV
jgi:sorting nexin-25